MRTMILSLCAVASSALAQPLTGVYQWQVSADEGVTWSSFITINPGDPYRIRGIAGWTDGPTPTVGFAGCSFDQIDFIGADATDSFGGASGPGTTPAYLFRRQGVEETWLLDAGSGASAGGLKLDNPSGVFRTNLGQIPYWFGTFPYDRYSFNNPVLLIDMDAVAGDPKALTVSATWTRLGSPTPTNEFRVYMTWGGESRKPAQQATMTDAHVWIRPNAACVPDFNGDGLVDFADYLEFLSFFDTQDFRADLNRDGVVDFADYLEFLTAYDAGC